MYDVVVVGASVAGCTAATLYGRAGLRVALVERSTKPDAHKALCGHFVLGGTQPTLERLGLWDAMVDEGAVVSTLSLRTAAGWIPPRDDVPPAISLRRSRLDPLLRRTAAATPGVDLLLGHEVVGVLERGRAVEGVRCRADGQDVELRGRLVIGADGHRSRVASLAGVRDRQAPNERCLWWAYYRGVERRGARVWFLDPDVAVETPTDDGLTLIGYFPSKANAAPFDDDRAGALAAALRALPDGPDLRGAERASAVVGTSDYPCVRRPPVPRPGLALVGDAATAGDPVPAVGCGWAFRSAEWLADATAPALADGQRLGPALRRYRRSYRFLQRHDRLARADARAGGANPVQRALWAAATRDDAVARRVVAFGMKAAPASHLLNPAVVVRALASAR